jgi:hypothetical protein
MIRLAEKKDLNIIQDIFNKAKIFMRNDGNMHQWNGNYPSDEILLNDISNNNLYVCYSDDLIYGVFYFYIGVDETYNYIEGSWPNNEEYGTIHRIASNGLRRGVFEEVLSFAKIKISNIRIDTHEDNKFMREKLNKNNFKYCGIIYINDGSPRRAYQYIVEE